MIDEPTTDATATTDTAATTPTTPETPDSPEGEDGSSGGVVERGELVVADGGPAEPTGSITQPAKVMRIGSMVKQLLEEVRHAPLDEPSRERLAEIYERSVVELSEALSPDLQEELRMLALPFDEDEIPSDAELRIAKAQLVGWLEGLFHGIQATLFTQQVAAQRQFEEMRGRRALEPGQVERPPGAYL